MRLRPKLSLPFLVLILCLGVASRAPAEDKFKLKPGARGNHCLDCHQTFQEKLRNPFVHTPVKSGDCTGCHNPHTSSHGKFLAAETREICIQCHSKLLPENAVSTHKVAQEGTCVACHDPHAEKNKFNLHKGGNALCFECHKELGQRVPAVQFKHAPVEKGCVSCHNPHGSTKAAKLLKDAVPSLCIQCHDTGRPVFQKQHMNYPVAGARCTSCHNPHGSNQRALLYDKVHSPFAKKMCDQCHEGPSSPTPLKTKKAGFELCQGCHSNMINEAFSKNRLHWALVDRVGCANCHSPHASDQAGLLKRSMPDVCGECHSDTVERLKSVKKPHPPVAEGTCTICHSPHASNEPLLLSQPAVIDLCGSCHDWQRHSTHPIGAEIKDPRNPNLFVVCLSCHRSHGTDYEKMLHSPTQTETCTNCHKAFRR